MSDDPASLQQQQQAPNTALVFVNDYEAGVSFEVISRLQQGTVNQILGEEDGDDGDTPVSDPTEYNGYVTHYTECGPGNYNLVFVRDESLQSDQSYSLGMDATYFSTEVQLLEVNFGGDGGDGDGEDDEMEANNETATGNETTVGNETAAGNETVGNATGAENDTVEVTNVTVGNETAGNETS